MQYRNVLHQLERESCALGVSARDNLNARRLNKTMMDKTKMRKIGAMLMAALSFLTFAAYSIHLILLKLSLPPYSVQTEGKYVAYSLEVFGFLWSIPFLVSLFLFAYLTHPSKFERFSMMTKVLSIILAIGGFGITVLLITRARAQNIFIFKSIAGTSIFWIMGIFAVFAFNKDKFENMKNEYKLTIFIIMTVVIVLQLWFVLFDLSHLFFHN